MKKTIFLSLASLLTCATISAEVIMPEVFSDNMVLQQQSECKIWGTATPGNTVFIDVSWNNTEKSAKADSNGKWSIIINALLTAITGALTAFGIL